MKRNPATHPASAETFRQLDQFDCVIDVRSPAEFADDHLPGAINCPVLDDEQRIEIGTLYKQVSPFAAKKLGAAMVSENIARQLRQNFLDQPRQWSPLIYCWRGGQRSGALTTVFRQIGWDARQLEGGYKNYRRFVIDELARLPALYALQIIKGATGSAKTRILLAMQEQGAQIIDLEALAAHKGSVLGLVPDTRQPSQKSFESALLSCLQKLDPGQPVFVEAESRKIGAVHVPEGLIDVMRASPSVTVDAPRAARVEYLLRDYAYFTNQVDGLLTRLDALKEIRGNQTVQAWHALALEKKWDGFVDSLLADHYDPLYQKSQAANYGADAPDHCHIATASLDDEAIRRAASAIIAARGSLPAAHDLPPAERKASPPPVKC